MDNVKVNGIRLATQLADRELRKTYKGKIVRLEDNGFVYTNNAQDKFNKLYDEFLNLINKCKV